MPSYSLSVQVPGSSRENIMALGYGTFQKLGWGPQYSGTERIIGYLPVKFRKKGDEILFEANEGEFHVTSKMVNGESFDVMKRNRKNTESFQLAFDEVRMQATENDLDLWSQALVQLQEETLKQAELEKQNAEEVERVMKLSSGSKTVTLIIIGLNVLVFVAMLASGANIMSPANDILLKWGANFSVYTLRGEWWRLLTNIFVHIGIIHILFNMYALYMIGNYLEPMLGKARYLSAYLSTGVIASVVSLWWHKDPVVSAGASGAIFGLYGVFLALLTTSLIPPQVRKPLLQTIGFFVLYNLFYGMKSGIDNSAHMGGLVSGFAFGYFYLPTLKNSTPSKSLAASLTVAALTLVAGIYFLTHAQNDATRYMEHLDRFSINEKKAIAPLNENDSAGMVQKLTGITLPAWNANEQLLNETTGYKVNELLSKQRDLLKEYVDLRLRQTKELIAYYNGDTSRLQSVNEISQQINEKIKALESLNK